MRLASILELVCKGFFVARYSVIIFTLSFAGCAAFPTKRMASGSVLAADSKKPLSGVCVRFVFSQKQSFLEALPTIEGYKTGRALFSRVVKTDQAGKFSTDVTEMLKKDERAELTQISYTFTSYELLRQQKRDDRFASRSNEIDLNTVPPYTIYLEPLSAGKTSLDWSDCTDRD